MKGKEDESVSMLLVKRPSNISQLFEGPCTICGIHAKMKILNILRRLK